MNALIHRLRLAAHVLRYGSMPAWTLKRVECPQKHPTSKEPCILGEGHDSRRCLAMTGDLWVAERRRFPRVAAFGAVWRLR